MLHSCPDHSCAHDTHQATICLRANLPCNAVPDQSRLLHHTAQPLKQVHAQQQQQQALLLVHWTERYTDVHSVCCQSHHTLLLQR
jgi:hypothetical protein